MIGIVRLAFDLNRHRKIFVPEQLNLVRKQGIGKSVNSPEHAAVSCIESARRSVDVLRFDLELPAASRDSPRLCGSKQSGPYTLPSNAGRHPNVPQNGNIKT